MIIDTLLRIIKISQVERDKISNDYKDEINFWYGIIYVDDTDGVFYDESTDVSTRYYNLSKNLEIF